MRIVLPNQLNYRGLEQLLKQHPADEGGDNHWDFDWSNTTWASLPELATLLCWSAKLVHLKKVVKWTLPKPGARPANFDDVRSLAELALGRDRFAEASSQLNKIRVRALSGKMSSRLRLGAIDRIRSATCRDQDLSAVARWIDTESESLRSLDLLGYLVRYSFFDRAGDVGVTFEPHWSTLPHSPYEKSETSACLEFVPLRSFVETENVLTTLTDPAELSRIFGQYAHMDVVRRGALAHVLVSELGRNIEEHAQASGAWLCTRVLQTDQIGNVDDPVLHQLKHDANGFLEVIVCDDGRGLTHGLDAVLMKDQRQSVRKKYALTGGRVRESDLVDYAFDRLSSTKRSIAELVHATADDPLTVASGLYWIWNVVRSYRGLLGVRTGTVCGWYSFCVRAKAPGWELPQLATDPAVGRFPGTMIRIYLPLGEETNVPGRPVTRWSAKDRGNSASALNLDRSHIEVCWIGKILRRRFIHSRKSRSGHLVQHSLWESEESIPLTMLRQLQDEHASLHDGDVLLLDLSGTGRLWDQASVAVLWQFFTELNYTSTVGRSAVVLWNVPSSVEGLFDVAIADADVRMAKLKGVRRIGLLVRQNGDARFHCGWSEAEQILRVLSYECENDLDDIGGASLSSEDRRTLTKLITENSHLFEWVGNDRVRLRAWPQELQMAAWRRGTEWLNEQLDKDASTGGVLRRQSGAFFRLPSTGSLVKDFYSFGGLISNHEGCARLGWLLFCVLQALERRNGTQIRVLVSVTRPVMALASHLVENYYFDRDLTVLLGTTTDDLRIKGAAAKIEGPAVLITDVVSSGFLCDRVHEALPGLQWLGTITILDTGWAIAGARPAGTGIEVDIDSLRTRSVATGDVYSLATRYVEKASPENCEEPGQVLAIDPVNVCPIVPPEPQGAIGQPIWPYLERRPQALQIGHYHAGDLHHYIYYVNAEKLIEATHPVTEHKLVETIVDSVVDQLNSSSYDPDRTVVMHPPRETSYAEIIAVAVQRATGALYRHVLHRDTFAGQRRFSSYVAHGVPLAGATVIIIDDGSNTGETLVGLLHAAASARPARVLAQIALSRMPLHKVDLFRRMSKLQGVDGSTRVGFSLRLVIPAFSPPACPICRFRSALDEVVAHAGSLRRYARSIQENIESIPTGRSGSTASNLHSHWCCTSAVNAARLREAIELADYDSDSGKHIIAVIKSAIRAAGAGTKGRAELQDLAFVICSEPDLLVSPLFAPFLPPLFEATCRTCVSCGDGQLQTVVGFAFHLMIQISRKSKTSVAPLARSLWKGTLGAKSFTIANLGQFLASCLADIGRAGRDEQVDSRRVCAALVEAFQIEVEQAGAPDIVRAIGKLFVREVSASLEGHLGCPPLRVEHGGPSMFHLASETASKFYWHASETLRALIHQGLKPDVLNWDDVCSGRTQIADDVHSLLVAFGNLQELQQSLCRIDEQLFEAIGQKPDAAVHWDAPDFTGAMASFAEPLTSFGELALDPSRANATVWAPLWNELSQAWDNLKDAVQPAISEIFPNIRKVIYDAWTECEARSGLPSKCIALEKTNVAEDVQCFLPRTLLIRFLNLAMENLKTSAFVGWSAGEIATSAHAVLSLQQENQGDGTTIGRLRLMDNGRLHRKEGCSGGSGHGLSDLQRMVAPFGACLVGPSTKEDMTLVELSVFLRGARSPS